MTCEMIFDSDDDGHSEFLYKTSKTRIDISLFMHSDGELSFRFNKKGKDEDIKKLIFLLEKSKTVITFSHLGFIPITTDDLNMILTIKEMIKKDIQEGESIH